ncbi:SdpI family protein [Caulobacter sp. 17J80-11]|uniref:SdpI family protein n=1 Tax=Caulobacter sp. 17J80-11 TaxID=2763502 RepID=UPI0016539C0C|nr:SdpI family protein [Caulobacter sp. 17J80-11]MBC6982498.1 SdpI family protein [Caulobacter sp. 17J80-11]
MNKDLKGALAWGGGILVVALAASYARHHGYVDNDTVTRLVVGLNGLMIAWFGNRIPKTVVPSACARQAQRVAGWSMVLSGLAYAGLWAFAPMQVAITAGCGAVIAGIVVTIGYCLWLRARAKTA